MSVASEQENNLGVRLLVLNLPEDEGEGLGFRLTRTLWDPYPWVREVMPSSRAEAAGLKTGDCILQSDGQDLLGMPIGQVAGLIRGDGCGGGVTLLVWNCGVDPQEDPELLWSAGGGARGERSRRALSNVIKALACSVCAATSTKALNCGRSHLYCEACWTRLQRCALCREPLPSKDSPYAKNLVAEQVFEAIATEYDIKDTLPKAKQTASAYSSPNRTPNISPTATRKGQYQLSMMRQKKAVQFMKKTKPNYSSDPNIHRSSQEAKAPNKGSFFKAGNSRADDENGGKVDNSQCSTKIQIHAENDKKPEHNLQASAVNYHSLLQHKLVARLRPSCSLVDLQNGGLQTCVLSKSLNSIITNDKGSGAENHGGSLDDLKNTHNNNESPVYLLAQSPILLLACDHNHC